MSPSKRSEWFTSLRFAALASTIPLMYASRLSYVHLRVRHLEASVTFYTRFLDLQLSERFAQTSLLVSSGNTAHFELALTEGDPGGPITLGFELETTEDFEAAKAFVKLEDAAWRLEERGFAHVLILQDPDGNTVELFLDRRKQDGQAFWRGMSTPL